MSEDILEVIDYSRTKAAATEDGTGTATITIQPPAGVIWLVDRAAIRATGATGALRVYIGAVANDNIIDGSDSGNFDISDNAAPWYVAGGTPLILQWTGLAAGAVCTANLQYKIAARGPRRGTLQVPNVTEQALGLPLRRPRHKIRRAYGGW